jgi:hypothetical protein
MQFHSFTTSVVPLILIAVSSKKEKLPLSVTHPELAKEADGWDPDKFTADLRLVPLTKTNCCIGI